MTIRLIGILFVSVATTAVGQHRGPYWSLGGFGNVLFPGTGHPPATPPGGVTGPYFFSNGPGGHGRWAPGTAILSGPETAVPEDPNGAPVQDYKNEGTSPDASHPAQPQIIDQELIGAPNEPQPDVKYQFGCEPHSEQAGGGRDSSVRGTIHKSQQSCDGKPTVYLLALKDGTVLQSLGYWTRGSILYYVSVDYALNQISLILIDKGVSKRLNAEQGIDVSPDFPK